VGAERFTKRDRGVWPTRDQELLLRAAFAAEAGPGYQWIERTDIERVDPGSFQLLPQLYRNLAALSVTGPVMERLRGVYRYSWSVNTVALRHARLQLASLGGAGVRARVIGPAAFLQRYYGDLGARLVDGLQLLVRPRDLRRSLAALQEAGLAPVESIDVDRLFMTADWATLPMGGRAAFVHWSLVGGCSRPDGDGELWSEEEQIEVDGSPATALNVTDDLLFVLVRGARWELVPSFRWLSDAMAILRSAQARIDWDRLLHRAHTLGVVLPMRQSLAYLQHRLGQSIPPRVLGAAESQAVSLAQHLESRVRREPPGMLGRLPDLIVRYLAQSRGVSPVRRAFGLMGWLQRAWGLPSIGGVPGYVVRRGWERVQEAAADRRISRSPKTFGRRT
jgi:hypothetical protein